MVGATAQEINSIIAILDAGCRMLDARYRVNLRIAVIGLQQSALGEHEVRPTANYRWQEIAPPNELWIFRGSGDPMGTAHPDVWGAVGKNPD